MSHVATITIDHTKVPGDLTDYVGLIVPDGSAGYAALYALCLEGGGDIRLFKSDDTTELAREMVSFSVTTETGEIHYKYSGTLSSSVDTAIHVYADGSSADYAVTATYGRNAVWSNYRAVWHLDGLTDSSGNGYNFTAFNSPTYTAGKIGNAVDFSSSAGKNLSVNSSLGLTHNSDLTVDFWFLHHVAPTATQDYWAKAAQSGGKYGWYINYNSANRQSWTRMNSGAGGANYNEAETPTVSTWYQSNHTYKSSNTNSGYRNGVLQGTFTSTGDFPASGESFSLGTWWASLTAGSLKGMIDEVRVRNEEATANWITTEYNNQNDYSTFYSVAAVAGGSSAQVARRGAVMMM